MVEVQDAYNAFTITIISEAQATFDGDLTGIPTGPIPYGAPITITYLVKNISILAGTLWGRVYECQDATCQSMIEVPSAYWELPLNPGDETQQTFTDIPPLGTKAYYIAIGHIE